MGSICASMQGGTRLRIACTSSCLPRWYATIWSRPGQRPPRKGAEGPAPLPRRLAIVEAMLGLATARADRRRPRRLHVDHHRVVVAAHIHDAPPLGSEELL